MKKVIDPCEYYCIQDMYFVQNMSQQAIANIYGVSHATIGKIVRLFAPARVGGGRYLQEELEQSNSQIIDLKNQGLSVGAIALMLDISSASISERLQRLGLKPEIQRAYHSLSEKEKLKEKIALAYKFGLTNQEIKERFRVGLSTIQKTLAENNITTRKRGEWCHLISKALAAQRRK